MKAHFIRILAASLLAVLLGLGLTAKLGETAPWSFAVLGDTQSPYDPAGINTPIATAMAAQIATQNPAFVLGNGDLILGVGNLTDQYTNWKAAMAPILGISYPVRGNHEASLGDVNIPGPNYAKSWMDNIANALAQIPKNGPPNEVGMSYSFSNKNVFIIGLEESYATTPYQVNQTWLNAQLQANTLPFTFVYGHYPAFGLNVPNTEFLSKYPAQRDAFWQSLGDSSVNIYFTAHVHLYDRAMISINGGPEIQQIVVGAGGAPLSTWNGYQDPRVIGESHQDSNYGYTLVTVNGNTITAVYYIFDGVGTWTPFDTYIYTIVSRNFGANNANQSLEPTTLNDYYQGIRIIKTGSGMLTLNPGASTYTDGFTVSGGTLKVQGDYSQAPVTVQSGGSLSGTGTIGNVTNSGTVSPGNSPGTLNVVGNYTQTASGILRAEIASPTSYDKVDVTGTANLAGTLTPVLLNGYRPPVNTRFTDIIKTSAGLTGTFSSVGNFTPTLIGTPLYSANSIDLLVQRDYTNSELGLNSNQTAVGAMLNGLAGTTSGDLGAVLNTMDNLPAASDVQSAYKQISPEKAGALATLGFAGATFQVRNLATRATNLRFVQGGIGEGGSVNSGNFGFNYSRQDGVMLAYNGASLSNLFSARKEFKAPESRWGLFADGGAVFGSQKTSVNQTGFDFTLAGFTAGADYRLRDDLLLGLATGYSHTGSGFHGSGGNVNANTVPVNAYAAYLPGSFYAYGSLGYALNLFDLERGLNFGGLARTAKSSTTGHQFNLYGETGYDLKLRRFILTPSATLSYSNIWVGSLDEQGADSLSLKVEAQNAASLQTGLGGRVTVPLKVGPVKVAPQGFAFYQHEFANGSRGLNASLSQGSSTFNFQTDAAKRNFAVVGGNVTVGLTKNLYAQVNYNAEVGRSNYTAQNINAGLRLEF